MPWFPEVLEIAMLLCFGSSWPFAVAKTLRTKTVKGKSIVFLVLIFIGYVSGVLYKIAADLDPVICLYILNGSMVFTEIILYLKYSESTSIPSKNIQFQTTV